MKNPFPFPSIALKLMALIIPISLLGIFLTGVFAYYNTKPYILKNVKDEVKALGFEASQNISSFFKQRENDLEMISESPLFADHTNNLEFGLHQEAETYLKEIERYLTNFSKRTGVYSGIWYLNEGGRKLISIGEFQEEPFLNQFGREPIIRRVASDPIINTSFGPMVLYAKPLKNAVGDFQGTIVLGCSLKPVQDILNRLRSGPSGWVFLSDSMNSSVLPDMGSPNPSLINSSNLFSSTSDIPGTPWKVAVLVDLNNFLTPLKHIRFFANTLILLCGLLVALFIYIWIWILIRPIQKLKKATERFTAGHLSERVSVVSKDEVGALSNSFNVMAETLQSRTEDLEAKIRELRTLACENAELIKNIRRSEARYRTTLESSLDAIVGLDSSFRITTWNRAAQSLFGYSSSNALGKHVTMLFPIPAAKELMKQVHHHGVVRNYDIEGLKESKESVPLNLTLASSEEETKENKEWSLVIRDVTEQKQLQAQLIQSEKLSVVGQLVSGIAHEINNPLTAVVGYAELLSTTDEKDGTLLQEDLKFIQQNAVRCREIVSNLLRFVRKGPIQKKPVQINEVIQAVIQLLDYRLVKKEAIQVEMNLDPHLPFVGGDFQQLEQVFVNLIQNACDALSGRAGPRRISIQTQAMDHFVQVQMADNGPGISKEIREKLFEPFFTTKADGRGTGLGLAISRRIVQDHMGILYVESTPGRGTTFILKLPGLKEGLPDRDTKDHEFPSISGKNILVIDDEPDLIPLMRQILLDEGNKVEVATSGNEGLQKLKNEKFDLVISDVALGDIHGQQIAQAIQTMEYKPALIFVTGDILNDKLMLDLQDLGIPYISKPFSLSDFRKTVRTTLANLERTNPKVLIKARQT